MQIGFEGGSIFKDRMNRFLGIEEQDNQSILQLQWEKPRILSEVSFSSID
jgi:hypothetical protein